MVVASDGVVIAWTDPDAGVVRTAIASFQR
jgi:hypothetical protein